MHSLVGWQDQLVNQAERGDAFAGIHIGTGGGTVGGMTGLTVVGGLVAAQVIALPLLGPAAAVATVPGIIWAAASAKLSYEQHRLEHKSKWRQRAARALGFEMSRTNLEHKLAGVHPDGPGLHVEFREGEYVPEEEGFKGRREMEFDARKNEYLGLHALALRVQDLILEEGSYEPNSPFMQLLDAIGIDAVRLLAICKAASAKPVNVQLDYIQSRIASRLEMKLRMEGELQQQQALPHVSHFLGHFDTAWKTQAPPLYLEDGAKPVLAYSPDLYPGIREELAKLYPDPQAGLQAFDTAVKAFLAKAQAQGVPETPYLKMLKGFAEYSAARGKFDGLVKRAVKREAEQKKRAMEKEMDGLVEELERSARREQVEAIR